MGLTLRTLALMAALGVVLGVFHVSLGFFRSEEEAKAAGRVSLYRSMVVSEIERFSHLSYGLARDTRVIETATGGPAAARARAGRGWRHAVS
jgi:two-component system C4-dicarboxylate transport sensor histidine kinase DctB